MPLTARCSALELHSQPSDPTTPQQNADVNQTTADEMNHRRPPILSLCLALTLKFCSGGGFKEADRFTKVGDVSLGSSVHPLQNQPQTTQSTNSGRSIFHSSIDRDPIYEEEDLQCADDSIYNTKYYEVDVFSTSQEQIRQTQWKSPLERVGSLPSLTLSTHQNINPTIASPSATIIHDGPRHKHEIDISQTTQLQTQHNLQLKTRSTGTTITALLACNSTVLILAADTRATDGTTVADKRCEKLHMLAKNVWCAGAGTSADVEALVRGVKFVFWVRGVLDSSGIGNMGGGGVGGWNAFIDRGGDGSGGEDDHDVPSASVPAVLHYIRSQLQKSRGSLGANLLVGGYDPHSHRATLAAIHPHGSMDVVTYAALGSGGLAATGVLESRYPKIRSGHCTVEEGIRLAVDAVRAGIDNDLGSGSQVDVCVVSREGVLYRRAVVREEELEWVSMRNDQEEDHRTNRDFGSAVSSGVNGFGNVPFAIQSKRIVVSGDLDAEREKRKWLDAVLGAGVNQ